MRVGHACAGEEGEAAHLEQRREEVHVRGRVRLREEALCDLQYRSGHVRGPFLQQPHQQSCIPLDDFQFRVNSKKKKSSTAEGLPMFGNVLGV